MYEWFLMSYKGFILSFIAEFEYGQHLNLIQNPRVLSGTFLLPNMTCNWHVLRHLVVNVFSQ